MQNQGFLHAGLILFLYPFVDQFLISNSALLSSVVTYSLYFIGVIFFTVGCLFLFIKFPTHNHISLIKQKMVEKLTQKFEKISSIKHIESFAKKDISDLLTPILKPNISTAVVMISILIHIALSLANFYFFQSLNTPVPFMIHLFLKPIFSIVLLLPVSFGGIGIREGVYVIFYALFGVPMEAAVMVSFLCLFGSLVNSAIGGMIMFFKQEDNA